MADNNTVSAANVSITKTAKSMTLSGEKVYFASDVKFIFVNEGKATVLDGVQKVNNKTVYVALSQDESTDPFMLPQFMLWALLPTPLRPATIWFMSRLRQAALHTLVLFL